jgi:F-type H+-transporting ATPase subunit epsilon
MSTLRLEIVTPERKAYSEEVTHVVLPGFEGEIDVLPHHVPLVIMIKPGEIHATKGGETYDLAVGEGIAEITGGHVTVLTDVALSAEQIDEGSVEDALKRAREALADKSTSSEELVALEASIQKSIAQLGLKRRRRQI